MMHAYLMAGLSVSSELPLPGARAIAEAGSPDIVMHLASVPTTLECITMTGATWQADGERILYRAPGVGRFLLTKGREVRCQPDDETTAADCAAYLQGTVLGLLLNQRGQIVLHASAVEVAGRAVLFCGRSGAGKSTLAAALCQLGYPLLSDDISAIRFDAGDHPRLSGDARQLKLASEAIASLDLGTRRGASILRNSEKYYVEPPANSSARETPLGAVYMLRPEQPRWPPGLDALDRARAVKLLQRNAYRPNMIVRMGRTEHYFEAAAEIARKAGIFRFTISKDLARLPDNVATLERHWAQIGLWNNTEAR